MSSILSSLKLTSAKRQLVQNPIEFRRQKLSNKLKEQVALATSMKKPQMICTVALPVRSRGLSPGTPIR